MEIILFTKIKIKDALGLNAPSLTQKCQKQRGLWGNERFPQKSYTVLKKVKRTISTFTIRR